MVVLHVEAFERAVAARAWCSAARGGLGGAATMLVLGCGGDETDSEEYGEDGLHSVEPLIDSNAMCKVSNATASHLIQPYIATDEV